MSARDLTIATMLAAAASLAGPAARAADPAYLGGWTIVKAALAPWADPAHPLDPSERARLIGKTITFTPHAIAGPQPLACRGAHYSFSDFTADMLFQGAFDEMRSRDKRVDPNRIAASLGFKGPKIRTLETGCEIDFHFTDAATAEFGLNDAVYTIHRK
jgi:hypothetical protein